MLAAETREPQPGGEAIITRLADVLVIQAIRGWIAADPAAQTGWLGALRDPHLGQALALIHGDPAREWTVAALAAELAMSRSAFAARFSELVGVPAMQYVTDWRMQLARTRLRDGASVGGGRRRARLQLGGSVLARVQARHGHAPGGRATRRRAGPRLLAASLRNGEPARAELGRREAGSLAVQAVDADPGPADSFS